MLARILPLVLLAACGQPKGVPGQVMDVWGNPVPDAMIVIEGQSDRYTADMSGRFELPPMSGPQTLKIGAKGYIHDYVEWDPSTGKAVSATLYKKPEKAGFYLVGAGDYYTMEPQLVERKGTELDAAQGIRKEPKVAVEAYNLEILFHTDLNYTEIKQIGLELHRLEFKDKVQLAGPLGPSEVDLNLWVSAGEVPVQIKPMRSRQDYRIEIDKIEPGYYAFTTQDLLDPGEGPPLESIPPEVRISFPFQVR
ncbi:MAG: hypothetical protein JXX28_12200 [Deltaproteobacteria bacterium]|nr:hypothetical protein [Deltaproteobacteria bacterium]